MSEYIIKCSFCPTLNLLYSGVEHGWNCGNIPRHHYCCVACYSDFYYDSSFRLVGWDFKVDYKSDRYSVNWSELDGNTLLFKNGYVITEFTNRANLTPFNLVQKLPTILVFM